MRALSAPIDQNPAKNTVIVDLAKLFASTNLDTVQPMPPGCMSDPTDQDCAGVYKSLGLKLAEGVPDSTPQTLFRIE